MTALERGEAVLWVQVWAQFALARRARRRPS
jgi:hypothetical protein